MKADFAPILRQVQTAHVKRRTLPIKLSPAARVLGVATKFVWPIFSTRRVENWVGSGLMREKRLKLEVVR